MVISGSSFILDPEHTDEEISIGLMEKQHAVPCIVNIITRDEAHPGGSKHCSDKLRSPC
jgi:hypothetical protein